MKPLAYFVITFEAWDTDEFAEELRRFDLNGVAICWNYAGEIKVMNAPSELGLAKTYRYFTPKTWTENRWIKWPSLVFTMSRIMTKVFSHTTARRFYLGGGDLILWVAQVFKMAGRIEKMVTTCEDWSLPKKAHSFYDWLNREKFLLNDWLMSRMDVTVIMHTREIHDLRNHYWKGLTAKNSILMENKWASLLKAYRTLPARRPGNSIALLGTIRRNFGLEILFDLLPELNRTHGIRLKIIGLESELFREYKKKCDESGASRFIDWLGWVDNSKLTETLGDCFCGYDMQESPVNNSKLIVPGRVMSYFQNLVVPVISVHSGVLIDFIRERKLGVVCEPDRASIERAIVEAHERYTDYAANIERFLKNNPYRMNVSVLLEGK